MLFYYAFRVRRGSAFKSVGNGVSKMLGFLFKKDPEKENKGMEAAKMAQDKLEPIVPPSK